MHAASHPRVAEGAESRVPSVPTNTPFVLLLASLVFEYARPQESVPLLKAIPLSGILTVLLAFSLFATGRVRVWTAAPAQTRLYVLFLLLLAAHVPFAVNNRWAFNTTFGMSLTFVVYLALVTLVDTPGRFARLMSIWILVHAYLGYEGIRRHGRGIGGFLGDQNDLAITLNMAIPIAFSLALAEKRPGRRVTLLFVSGLILVGQITTLSRGGFVGLVAVGVVAWLRMPRKLLTLGLILGLFAAAATFAPAQYWKDINTLRRPTEDKTAQDRFYQWEIGWNMFLDNPIVGVGPGNFPYRFREYEVKSGYPEGFLGRSRAGRAAHSLYFTLLPELGLVGTGIYLAMLGATWRALRRLGRAEARRSDDRPGDDDTRLVTYARALEASLVGFLASGAFIAVLYYPLFWTLMGFVAALERLGPRSHGASAPAH